MIINFKTNNDLIDKGALELLIYIMPFSKNFFGGQKLTCRITSKEIEGLFIKARLTFTTVVQKLN